MSAASQPPAGSPRQAADRAGRGFTLVEISITLALVGMIMATIYTVLFGTLREKENVERKVAGSRIGPLLLDQVERDLRQLFAFNVASGAVFKGEDLRVSGYDADRITMVAYTPSTSPAFRDDRWVYSAVNEIGYVLTQNPENPDFLILWRREDYFVDDDPLAGGKGTPLYRRVTRFNVTYFDEVGEDADSADEWDTGKAKKMPGAIKIELAVEIEPRVRGVALSARDIEHRTYSFVRFVTFPEESNLAMAVRPALPVPPEEGGSGDPITGQDGTGDDDVFGGGMPGGGAGGSPDGAINPLGGGR